MGRLTSEEFMRVILPPFEMREYFQLFNFFWIFSVILSQKGFDFGLPPRGISKYEIRRNSVIMPQLAAIFSDLSFDTLTEEMVDFLRLMFKSVAFSKRWIENWRFLIYSSLSSTKSKISSAKRIWVRFISFIEIPLICFFCSRYVVEFC